MEIKKMDKIELKYGIDFIFRKNDFIEKSNKFFYLDEKKNIVNFFDYILFKTDKKRFYCFRYRPSGLSEIIFSRKNIYYSLLNYINPENEKIIKIYGVKN